MADLSDVSAALRALCSAALYPPASYPSGPAGNSLAGLPVLIQSGWPDPNSLQTQIAAKAAQVTVYPQAMEKNVTRYQQVWEQTGPLQAPTFTLAQAGQVVTVAGVQPTPTFYGQNFAIFANGKPYIYRCISSDTPSTIAAALAALIEADIPSVTVSGPAITFPSTGGRIGALRVGTQAPVAMELKRQERYFLLIVWAPTTASRDQIASYIDVAIPMNKFLTLADGSEARLIYKGSPYSDFDQKQGIYRRDFSVSVEYATFATDIGPEVIAVESDTYINNPDNTLGTEGGSQVTTESGSPIHLTNPDFTQYN